MWPRERGRGRAKWSVELLDHLRLALEDEHVRAAQRAHVERLVTRVQDENLLHPGRNVPEADRRSRPDRHGRRQRPIARSTASCSSGERATDGPAAVELLHVDPRVVAALDRGHDDARAGRVEQRERRRLVAARVLVGVVADDRGVRDRAVDAPVDAGEPGRRPRRRRGAGRRSGPAARRRTRRGPCRPPPSSIRCASRDAAAPAPRRPQASAERRRSPSDARRRSRRSALRRSPETCIAARLAHVHGPARR